MCKVKVLLQGVPTFSVYSATPVFCDVTCEKTAGGARVYVTKGGRRDYHCHWSVDLLSLTSNEESQRLWKEHPDLFTQINAVGTRNKLLNLLWSD